MRSAIYLRVVSLGLAGLGACTGAPDARQPAAAPPEAARPAPADTAAPAVSPRVGRVSVDTAALPRRQSGPTPGPAPARDADTLGARPAAYWRGGLRALGARPGPETYLDTLGPRLLRVGSRAGLGLPRLLYRAAPADTVWTDLTPELDRYGRYHDHLHLTVAVADLAGPGRPALLLTLTSSGYGSGAGGWQIGAWLFDVTPPRPRLLLRVRTAEVDEQLSGYAARHGLPFSARDQYTGFQRTAVLRPGELRISPLKLLGRFRRRDLPHAPLPAGRYRYQGGQLIRISL